MMTTWFAYHRSLLGEMLLVAQDDVLTGVYFVGQRYQPAPAHGWRLAIHPESEPIEQARGELDAYFAGRRQYFDVHCRLIGTSFQLRVWHELAQIGYGARISYAALAARIGAAGAASTGGMAHARPVGAAVARNPLSIIVPCHRVLASSGALAGYAGGLERKRALLALESGSARRPLPFDSRSLQFVDSFLQ